MTNSLLLANEWAAAWGAAFWRASWQGGLALGLAYFACRLLPGLPANARCWLWRIVYLKLVVALFWSTPIPLPILPAETPLPARWSSEAPRVLSGPAASAQLPHVMRPFLQGAQPWVLCAARWPIWLRRRYGRASYSFFWRCGGRV